MGYGIISVTTSEFTAQSFSQCTGLLWTIASSYSNRFSLIICISTDWFSAFKNEREYIAFNSFLPIAKTKNYAQSDDEKVDILMKQLQIYKKQIHKPKHFYKELGFAYDEKWIGKVLEHRLLFRMTEYNQQMVYQRFTKELNIGILNGTVLEETIDILINKLIARKKKVNNKDMLFWQDIGFKFSYEWTDTILEHRLLFHMTEYNEQRVYQRFQNELRYPNILQGTVYGFVLNRKIDAIKYDNASAILRLGLS